MAPEVAFQWDDANRRHLARHDVTAEEAEQVVLDEQALLVEVELDDEERVKVLGMTARGRILAVVFTLRGELIRPITAYMAPPSLATLYLRGRSQ